MHTIVEKRCVFGCGADQDSLRHYFVCPLASATLANHVVAFRTPGSMVGLAPCSDAQRSDAAVGIMTLRTARCAERAGEGACAMRARDQLQAAAWVVRLRVAAALKERPLGEHRRTRR